jgi:ABC-type sugar transport system substrate-binding protein
MICAKALISHSALLLAAALSMAAPAAHAADKGKVVVFMASTTNRYFGEYEKGLKDEAAALGYGIKVIENNFDQAEEDSQVQQELASGEKAAGYIWMPTNNAAGVGSLKALHETGAPVVQANQLPVKGTESLWTAYAGVSDFLNGKTAGELLLKACDESKTVKCGKGLIIRFPAAWAPGDDRIAGFKSAIGSKLDIIEVVDSGGFQETEGYKIASQVLPAHKGQYTWIYTQNDSLASGVLQALTESGVKPGKDVLVVGGTCHGDETHLLNGDLVGTGIQPAYLEGRMTLQTLVKYLNTKKVEPGEAYLPADPAAMPSDEGAPHKYNFLPNPGVVGGPDALKGTLWGKPLAGLCDY